MCFNGTKLEHLCIKTSASLMHALSYNNMPFFPYFCRFCATKAEPKPVDAIQTDIQYNLFARDYAPCIRVYCIVIVFL